VKAAVPFPALQLEHINMPTAPHLKRRKNEIGIALEMLKAIAERQQGQPIRRKGQIVYQITEKGMQISSEEVDAYLEQQRKNNY
jgi:hypothetical protein